MSAFIAVTQLHEGVDILRERRLAHAVDVDAVALLVRGEVSPTAGQHVHLGAVRHQVLRQLAHVAAQAALDDRRVLPGDQQYAHGEADASGRPASASAPQRREPRRAALEEALHALGEIAGGEGLPHQPVGLLDRLRERRSRSA